MATTWNTWQAQQPAAEKFEQAMKSALAVNRAMENTLVDVVAAYTPWLASFIPASLGYYNVTRVLHFQPWQGWIYAIVVECLGLATVATALKFWSWNQEGNGKRAPLELALLTGIFYLVITLSVNVILDEGTTTVKLVKALASTFSVVGALVVAMRAQQGKAESALAATKAEHAAQLKADEEKQERAEQGRLELAKLERERELETLRIQKEKELETLRLEAEERRKDKEAERNLRKELKLAEINLKVAENAAKVSQNVPESAESFQKVSAGERKFPETFGKWSDWRQLPDEHKQRIATLAPKQVRDEYGLSDKTAGNWVRKAQIWTQK